MVLLVLATGLGAVVGMPVGKFGPLCYAIDGRRFEFLRCA